MHFVNSCNFYILFINLICTFITTANDTLYLNVDYAPILCFATTKKKSRDAEFTASTKWFWQVAGSIRSVYEPSNIRANFFTALDATSFLVGNRVTFFKHISGYRIHHERWPREFSTRRYPWNVRWFAPRDIVSLRNGKRFLLISKTVPHVARHKNKVRESFGASLTACFRSLSSTMMHVHYDTR